MLDNKPRVSIILPTYNRSNILNSCIESIINQTFHNWELIICDDCSDDDTSIVSKNFADSNKNIYIVENIENLGLPKNRNQGLNLAQGELIFFIEDDLILDANCLNILVDTYDNLSLSNNVGGIAPRLIEKNQKIISGKGPFIINKLTGVIINNYGMMYEKVCESPSLHACSIYPTQLLREINGYAETAYVGNYVREETDLNFRIKNKGYKLYFQSQAFAYHNKISSGGCRVRSRIIWECYYVRNHVVFLIRIFKIKSLCMVPLFLISYLYDALCYILKSSQKSPDHDSACEKDQAGE